MLVRYLLYFNQFSVIFAYLQQGKETRGINDIVEELIMSG